MTSGTSIPHEGRHVIHVERLTLGQLDTNCYILSDGGDGPVAVIDPGAEPNRILEALGTRALSAIILTHGHFDHLGAVGELITATGAPLLVHELDAVRVTHDAADGTGGSAFGFDGIVAPAPDRVLHDDEIVKVGTLGLRVLHTPGHTQGGVCLFVEDPDGERPHLFSGDTLFAGSVGRSDFPGGDGHVLSRSIARHLTSLPPNTVVHPGHGPETTIGREARVNPFWPRA